MKKLSWLLRIVGALQLVLGLFYLLVPDWILTAMGHSKPAPDLNYPLAMLAARFVAYGIAFWTISNRPAQHRLWITNMIIIQSIDLMAGIYYTVADTVSLSLSGLPMVNAAWITGFLILWYPRTSELNT